MRFSIDAHAIGRRLTGNEVYVRNLLAHFRTLDSISEFTAYFSTRDASSCAPAGFQKEIVSPNPFRRLGLDLRARLLKDRPDLLHVQYTAPLNCPVPVVVTVHDVSFIEFPECLPLWRRLQLSLTVERTVRRAARVITGSEFSRRAIARAFGLDEMEIAVVPNAAAPLFHPLPRHAALARVRARFGLAAPFVLTVGNLAPRKNHARLIRGFAEAVKSGRGLPQRLVIAGRDFGCAAQLNRAARESGVADRILLTGFVDDRELLDLYNACDAFVFPSLYEGFGIPPLEAMACGRAVACSSASALPEVCGPAALYFEPQSPSSIARALLELLLDGELRGRMEKMGLKRAAHFSWRKSAEQTLDIYRAAVGPPRRRVVPSPAFAA